MKIINDEIIKTVENRQVTFETSKGNVEINYYNDEADLNIEWEPSIETIAIYNELEEDEEEEIYEAMLDIQGMTHEEVKQNLCK